VNEERRSLRSRVLLVSAGINFLIYGGITGYLALGRQVLLFENPTIAFFETILFLVFAFYSFKYAVEGK